MEEQVSPNMVDKKKLRVNFLTVFLILVIIGLVVTVLGMSSGWKFKEFDLKSTFIAKEDSIKQDVSGRTSRFVSKYGFSIDVPNYSDYGLNEFTAEEIEILHNKYEVATDLKNHWYLALADIDTADASSNLGTIVEDVSLTYNLSPEAWNSLQSENEEISPLEILYYRVQIYVYENTKGLTLEKVLSEIRETNDISGAVYGEVTYSEISGEKVAKFTGGNSELFQDNIVAISGDYIYVIEKVVSDKTASESMSVLDSIIDSIKFE
ncbi:MAG TPA: hypothetical protein PKI16_00640 [Candidatus Dojkabacteria bacterium]|nr:hypothetical protein [Candidatus Dojkabacteria bacterium]